MKSKRSAALSKTKTTQLAFEKVGGWGGVRRGAGRKNRSGRQGHAKRPMLKNTLPIHLTLRLVAGLPSLRRKDIFPLLRKAVSKARENGLVVVHYGFLNNHIHLIVEPRRQSISKTIQSLCISFAKQLNAHLGRNGSVFYDRYHIHVLATPREARNAIAYVLTNESRHSFAKARKKAERQYVKLDPYSSAISFKGWRKLLPGGVYFNSTDWTEDHITEIQSEILSRPRTWMLRAGWEKTG
jgi:REP element-mobilizing transposase RayT